MCLILFPYDSSLMIRTHTLTHTRTHAHTHSRTHTLQSFLTGIVPQQMKIAKVVPIFKTSDPTLPTNYRPISLLTTFSKLIERLLYNKVMNFLTENNILYKHQYGFRPKHSTIHPIIHLLNHIAENNKKKKELTLTLFCDLSKAFDVINNKIVLH